MLDELKVIVAADLTRLSAIYGQDQMAAARRDSIDEMPVAKHLSVLFDYVVNARLLRTFDMETALHELTDYFLETVPRSPMIDLHSSAPIEGICAWIVEMAVARWGLDSEKIGAFSIKQIATLANMDERSVRNAANPKAASPLKTFRDTEGNTMVARADAITWLQGRRSYKPMTVSDESGRLAPYIESQGFVDLQEMAKFLNTECEKREKKIADIIKDPALMKAYLGWWDNKVICNFKFEPKAFRALAKEIEQDERPFAIAAFKTIQKIEMKIFQYALDDREWL